MSKSYGHSLATWIHYMTANDFYESLNFATSHQCHNMVAISASDPVNT